MGCLGNGTPTPSLPVSEEMSKKSDVAVREIIEKC